MTATTTTTTTTKTTSIIPATKMEVVRPTEAQLRWAQFHYKERACSVRESCDRLWQTPETVHDVEGAYPEDGNSTTDVGGSDHEEIRERRPRVSRGRRAYLRVSRRVCDKRRQQIQNDGYASSLIHVANATTSANGSRLSQPHPPQDQDDDDDDDGLEAIFAAAPLLHRRKKQQRHRRNHDEQEHLKRFQAACHSIMMNMKASAPVTHAHIIPTRRWTRTADHVAMSTEHDFTGFKFGTFGRQQHQQHHTHNRMYDPSRFLPMDRGASWMVHLPHRSTNKRVSPYYNHHHDANGLVPVHYQENPSEATASSFISGTMPGRDKFEQLVAMVQQQVIARTEQERTNSILGVTPKMRLRGDLNPPPENGHEHYDNGEPYHEQYQDDEHDQGNDYVYPVDTKRFEYDNDYADPEPTTSGPPRMRLRQDPHVEQAKQPSPKNAVPRIMKLQQLGTNNNNNHYQDLDKPIISKMTPRSRDAQAPKMRLREFTAGRDPAVVRTVKHVPRMRLQDFAPLDGSTSAEQLLLEEQQLLEQSTSSQGRAAPPAPPKMRLRLYAAGQAPQQQHDDEDDLHSLQGHQASGPPKMRLLQHAAGQEPYEYHDEEDDLHSLEGPPKMRLRPYAVGQKPQHDEAQEEKKAADPDALRRRRKEHPLSRNFLSVSTDPSFQYSSSTSTSAVGKLSPGNSSCSKCLQPTPTGSQATASSDFFAQLRKETAADATIQQQGFCTDCGQKEQVEDPHGGALYSSVSSLNRSEKRASKHSSGSQATATSDFFAQLRNENVGDATIREQEFRPGMQASVSSRHPDPRVSGAISTISPLNQDTRVSQAFSSLSPLNQDPMVSEAQSSVSPLHHQDPGASSGAYSSVSPLNREDGGHGSDSFGAPHKSKDSPHGGLYDDEHNIITPRAGKNDPLGGLYDGENNGVTPHKSYGLSGRGFQDNDEDNTETSLSDLWNRGRASLQTAISSSLNVIPEVNQRDSSPANLQARAANVQGQVGGFFNSMLRGSKQEEDEKNQDSLALAVYRKSQEMKRESMSPDDASSSSSYRVLPAGLRSVVQGLYKSPSNRSNSSPALSSPPRSTLARSSMGELSPDIYKDAHDKVMRKSELLGDYDQGSIIDTDDTQSQASGVGMDPNIVASMMMSPTLLNKRLLQAVRAVEANHWQQVSYLISANPWLAEMSELTTKQYLLHKLAFFGGSSEDPATENLNQTLLDMFPAAVHKFDRDGNVPLHLAAASGNLKMIMLLGEKFASGASIRNEDGMLPLHFAIASYGEIHGDYYGDDQEDSDDNPSPLRLVKTVLKFFPEAVAIPDNDGNLPIHLAVECLEGALGVDVVYLLLDEADRQVQDPFGARFSNKTKVEELGDETGSTMTLSTGHETDSSVNADGLIVHCSMVRNDMGETPLITAIKTKNGWEMIEAIAGGAGGKRAALTQDADKNNALHLLVGSEYQDPVAALSILKAAPETASMRNAEGMLPIEIACMGMMPEEVIFSIVLVDLPVDADDKSGVKVRQGLGDSWWFLTCESDDHYFEIVQEVVAVCSVQQVRELCFMKGGTRSNGGKVISRATPKCRLLLTQALRFVGRFEFVGSSALYTDQSIGLKEFDALDFGGEISDAEDGRRVILKCYSVEESFQRETAILRDIQLDPTHVEEVLMFAVNEHGTDNSEGGTPQQYCISIGRPSLTLDRVVAGMLKNDGYKRDPDLRKRYSGKVCAVLRMVAKSLKHLHSQGVVHGDLCMVNCGKFDDNWKVMGTLGLQRIGQWFNPARWHESFPPEAVNEVDDDQGSAICDSDDAPVGFKSNLVAESSIDVWAFGKLAYEMLLGDPLLDFDASKKPSEDKVTLLEVMEWDESRMKDVFHRLLDAGIPESGADLITSCLFFRPDQRPASMDEILENPFWKEMRRSKEQSRRPKRSDESSVYTETTRMENMEI